MTRASVGRAAVRAYPRDIRMARGEELVGIMLDASEHSVAAFVRQLLSLVFGGLASRSRVALSQPRRQIVSDVVRFACIVIVARGVTRDIAALHWGGGFGGSFTTVCLLYVGPVLILALFTTGHDRVTGIVGLAWVLADILTRADPPLSVWVEFWLLPLLGFGLMAIAPRPEACRPRALWVIPAIVWAVFVYTELGQQSGAGYLTPVLATVVLLPIQPAVALGTALSGSLMAPWYLSVGITQTTRLGVALVSCLLLELILFALCQRFSSLRAR